MLKKYKLRNYNFPLVITVALLSIIGILMVGSAASSLQDRQAIGVAGGMIIMVIVSLIDYKLLLKFYRLIYLLGVALLGILLIPGVGETTSGATRWIVIAGVQFQPSEVCKVIFIVFFAGFLMKYQEKINKPQMLLLWLITAAVPLFLIFMEPNLSTTIIMALIFIAMLFVGGLSYKIVIRLLALFIPLAIVLYVLIKNEMLPLFSYQYDRIFGENTYQQDNSVMAIGSGQLWGKGLNNSSITSLKNGDFIPEPQTDFIFAIVGEELGFVGCLTVIILLLLIILECILIARRAQDLGGRLICCGAASWIGFQGFVNIAVSISILPNTGVPLPFVSYGLTSIISLFIAIGMVLNVGLQGKKLKAGGE